MDKRLSIIVVERDHDRAIRIVDGLREAGDYHIQVIADESGLAAYGARQRPPAKQPRKVRVL